MAVLFVKRETKGGMNFNGAEDRRGREVRHFEGRNGRVTPLQGVFLRVLFSV